MLEDMEFTPIFVRTDKKDENGLYFIRKRGRAFMGWLQKNIVR